MYIVLKHLNFRRPLKKIAKKDLNDSWSREVKGWMTCTQLMLYITKLVASISEQNIPYTFSPIPVKQKKVCVAGRSVKLMQQSACTKDTVFLEAIDDEQITIVYLVKFFLEFSEFPYSVVYMKQNLRQKMTKTLLLLILMEKLMLSNFVNQLNQFYMNSTCGRRKT